MQPCGWGRVEVEELGTCNNLRLASGALARTREEFVVNNVVWFECTVRRSMLVVQQKQMN